MSELPRVITPAPLPVLKPPSRPIRTSTAGRWLAAGIAVACLVLLGVAAYLVPDPAGVGMESRLGMPTCGFLTRTGLPCAGCGMTTAFSHVVRLQLATAFWVQPLGAVLALSAVATFWIASYTALTARPVHRLVSRSVAGRGAKIAVLVVAIGIVSWAWKMATMVWSS